MSSRDTSDSLRPNSLRQPCDTDGEKAGIGTQPSRTAARTADLFDDLARRTRETRKRTRLENERACREMIPPLFKAAVAAWPGGQEGYAARLGLARSIVVALCNGDPDRHIDLDHVLPLRECAGAWAIWTEGTGALGNLLVTVTILPRLTVADLKDDALRFILRNPSVLRIFREEEAATRNIGEDEVDAVVEKWKRGDEDAVQRQDAAPVQS